MSTRNEALILSAGISGFGYHPGAPQDHPRRLIEVDHYRQLVQTAERNLLDFVLLDDARALPDNLAYGRLDALSVLSRLAPETKSIGLAVSKPTTYSEPFTVSRELATLDFVSGGRAAWNVTTNASDAEAANYGRQHALAASERYAIAEEFVEVSRKLWDSWEDDAVITDRARGYYLDPTKLHHINHVGKHFKIRGPQITYRPPQGHVVVIQQDEGNQNLPLSPDIADVIILHHQWLEPAQTDYKRLKDEARAHGRQIKILQSILPILDRTKELARARATELERDAALRNGHATKIKSLQFVGTPEQFVDLLAYWFDGNATDGFHLLPAVLPQGLGELTQSIVPELQKRGLFRQEYSGQTLRSHLGLPRPESQYAAVN
ncbi:MAG: LLM class flavin-dependent oxidoreductase [Caldilineaceae bacterium]